MDLSVEEIEIHVEQSLNATECLGESARLQEGFGVHQVRW